VTGFGYRSGGWDRVGTVAELDAVTGDVPVVLTSGDAHNGWLNTAALRLLDLDNVIGPLEENDWFGQQPAITAELERAGSDTAALSAALADAASRGIVGVVDLEMPTSYLQWRTRAADGLDLLWIRASVYPEGLEEVLAAGIRTGDGLGSERVTMGPLKLISDGSLNTRTARCCEPYAGTRGTQNYDLDEMTALLQRAHEGGLAIALHAIGDEAVDLALQAFEATGAAGAIEHAQLVRPEDLPRMARLGVRASVQPAHLLDDRDVTEAIWPDRAERCFAFRWMLDEGVQLALGSDAPVSPLDPWLAIAAAVHRSADERSAWHPEQALTPREALAASVDGQGSVHAGMAADLVLLDADPLVQLGDTRETAAELRRMPVSLTLVGGEAAYSTL
jgi:predicted amidohydrolase YtcJ